MPDPNMGNELLRAIDYPAARHATYGDAGASALAVLDRQKALLAALDAADGRHVGHVLEAAHMLKGIGWRVKRPRNENDAWAVTDREWAVHCWYWVSRSLEHVRERDGLRLGGKAAPKPSGGIAELAAAMAGQRIACGAIRVPRDALQSAWAAGIAWLDWQTYADSAEVAKRNKEA